MQVRGFADRCLAGAAALLLALAAPAGAQDAAPAPVAPPAAPNSAADSLGLRLPTLEPGVPGPVANPEYGRPRDDQTRYIVGVERPDTAQFDAGRAQQLMLAVLQLPTDIPVADSKLDGEIVQLRFKDKPTMEAALKRLAATGTQWSLDRHGDEPQIDAVQPTAALDARVAYGFDSWAKVFEQQAASMQLDCRGGVLPGTNKIFLDVPKDPDIAEEVAGAIMSYPAGIRLEAVQPHPSSDVSSESDVEYLFDRSDDKTVWLSQGIWADLTDGRKVVLEPQGDGSTQRLTVLLDPLAAYVLRENAKAQPQATVAFTALGEVLATGKPADWIHDSGLQLDLHLKPENVADYRDIFTTAGLPPVILFDRINEAPLDGSADTPE